MWYENMHLRHKIRISIALVLFLFGVVDLFLNIFGQGIFMHWFHDIIWIWGSLALLATATVMAIDNK